MQKPTDLRQHLTTWVPDLAANPDKLHVFIEKGAIASKPGASLSFQYAYTLQLVITDFAESADVLVIPLLVWLQKNQPDLLADPVRRDRALAFEAEIVNHSAIDIVLTLDLTERVLVRPVPAGYEAQHIGEPPLPDLTGPANWGIYLGGPLLPPGNG